jgi:hypothetical protein
MKNSWNKILTHYVTGLDEIDEIESYMKNKNNKY